MNGNEVLCVGEAMAVLVARESDDGVPVTFDAHVGGAEANVALHLATQGIRVGWASRVGTDPFGVRVLADIERGGVDVGQVERDPAAPTGMYVKTRTAQGTTMTYFRSGSAASRMTPAFIEALTLPEGGWVHVSGITPALSDEADAAVDALFETARRRGVRVSFDVNYRPRLWPSGGADGRLRDLARRADLVFVGRDEAELLWGLATAEEVFDLLVDVPLVVVKDGDVDVAERARDGAGSIVRVPTPRAEVVELVGAGDAFAGGYLAGLLRGESTEDRIRRGQRSAAWTIGSGDDVRPGHRPAAFTGRERRS